MRYFVVQKDIVVKDDWYGDYAANDSDYTIPLGIYEVDKPTKDANGRWKVTPKGEFLRSNTTSTGATDAHPYPIYEIFENTFSINYAEGDWYQHVHEEHNRLVVTDSGKLTVHRYYKQKTYDMNRGKKKEWKGTETDSSKKSRANWDDDILSVEANGWEIGATPGGNNTGEGYCFYCKLAGDQYILLSSNDENGITSPHSEDTHKGSVNISSNSNSADFSDFNKGSLFNGVSNVEFTNEGKRGTYVDGKASTPYLMMELSAPGVSGSYNISIPANNFVDLNHERNLSDSFNKFSLNLFDKDATEVEAKLLLGFRNITFYYTDFVSESKRFTGEILNYQTVITGKGLMLTVTGYTSNVKGMIGQDSIPWKKLCEANSYGFYYWKNNNGDYFGIVCRDKDGKYVPYEGNSGATIVPYPEFQEADGGGKVSGADYPNWRDTYRDKLTDEEYKLYEPQTYSWALTHYNSNFKIIVGDNIQWSAKKPSDIVRAICAINGWQTGVIEDTKSVAEIPDQINESATEYIKSRLIPLSESRETGKAQYYFWFDDSGKANFRTGYGYSESPKTLYFNAGKDKADSYPLVGFTAATNGAVLMLKDASNYMDSVNVYTGDTLSSEIERTEDSIKSMGTTSDWFSNNKITSRSVAFRSKITYDATSSVPSQATLNTKLKARYELVAQYPYQAELQVRGCTDISPGDSVKIVIYLDESIRKAIGDGMHHTSGTYFVNKIVDTISGGKFISTMTCLKLGDLENYGTVNFDTSNDFGVEEESSSDEGSGSSK